MTERPNLPAPRPGLPGLLHRGIISLGCVVVGWSIMLLYLFWRYSEHAGASPRWYAMPVLITYQSLRYVGLTWLLLVLPLFLMIRPGAAFWRLFLCVPAFAGAGLLTMAFVTDFNYLYPWGLIWLLATICGAATGLAAAIVQRLTARRIQQASQPV